MTAAQRLDDCLSLRDGALFVEGCSAKSLAERFGTPLYVVSEDQLRRNARLLAAAFSRRWPGRFLLLPSIKANSSLALRRILTEEGTGCDVFGEAELEAALRTGTVPNEISLNGAMKGADLLERASERGVRITLDSHEELGRAAAAAERLRKPAHVRLRMRPDLVGRDIPSEMSPAAVSERIALDRYKAGIPTEDLLSIDPSEVENPWVDVAGIHLHVGRHSADPGTWRAAVAHLLELIAELSRRWDGWAPRELDLGGGFPTPRDPFGRGLPQRADAPPSSPGIEEFAAPICEDLGRGLGDLGIDPEGIQLEVEPGRSLYADAGIHLATVGNVKRQTRPTALTWVETDSSDAYLADVNLEFNRWTCLAASRASAPAAMTADVTGRTCALDVIVADAELPAIEPGEVLAFLDTGAYQEAAASNFNALPRPGTVLVTGDEAEVIRRRESIEEVFSRDVIPQRLRLDGDTAAPRVAGLDHVAVTSGDLDRSLAFYCDILGIAVRDRGEATGGEFDMTGIADARVRWADLGLGGDRVL
jgi:diaminopimelate decarboxylase